MDNQELGQNALKILSDDIYQLTNVEFKKLKELANEFLQAIHLYNARYQKSVEQTQLKNKITALYAAMRYDRQYLQNILALTNRFEHAINTFLGRDIYLTYVEADGNILLRDSVQVGEIYNKAGVNYGRGNLGKTAVHDIQNAPKEATQDLQCMVNEVVRNKRAVFIKAIERWEGRDPIYSNYSQGHEKQFFWVLKQQGGPEYSDTINKRGWIAEAYADAVINQDPNISNLSIETSLKALNNKIGQDSIPALVKADIIYGEDGSIQFAVKYGSFSTAKVGQYLNFAINILSRPESTPQEIEAALPQLVKPSDLTRQILKASEKTLKEALEEIFPSST